MEEADDEEWVILRIRDCVFVVRKPWVTGDWEVLATGFKSNEEAIKYVPLFNEEG